MSASNRRQFLVRVGGGLGCSAVGLAIGERLGFAREMWPVLDERLRFGALDPLVDLLQESAPGEVLPRVVAKLRAGTPLSDVVGAAALANTRAFGGSDYNAYHALMAMLPSYEMSKAMPAELAALPVLKVVHRNSRFIADGERERDDVLRPIGAAREVDLVGQMRRGDVERAEQSLAALAGTSRERAYEDLQTAVRDDLDVHRVVLSWRAWGLLRFAGEQNATTMLRQSVRYCIDESADRDRRGRKAPEIRALLPELIEKHGLASRELGDRVPVDSFVEELAGVVMRSNGADASRAVAKALADGCDPESVGAALSLAATMLLLNDPGRGEGSGDKPKGSVHGASVGVHASDAANAWRGIARTGSARNAFASLIAGAYHTAGQSQYVGAKAFDHDAAQPAEQEPAALLDALEAHVRERNQIAAMATARRYCELGHAHDALFTRLLPFAVSEDGALHAEKYFCTAREEHAAARAAHRPLYAVALARVSASSFGYPAPGVAEARELLSA